MRAGQTALALSSWPGLILALLTVSRWVKTDWHSSIFDSVATKPRWAALSLRMSSLAYSWKVLSVWMFVRSRVCVCTCNKGCFQEAKLLFFFHFFSLCCQVRVWFDSFEVLHKRQLLTFCCLMTSSVFTPVISSNTLTQLWKGLACDSLFPKCCFF